MRRSLLRRIVGTVLGLLVALSMSASVVQANQMAARMAVSYGMGDDGACDGCGGDGSGKMTTGCSVALCTVAVVAALPQTLSIVRVEARELPSPTVRLLFGSAPSPEPHPPRSSNLD